MTGLQGRMAFLAIVIGLGGAAVLADEAAPGKSSDAVSSPELEFAARAALSLLTSRSLRRPLVPAKVCCETLVCEVVFCAFDDEA